MSAGIEVDVDALRRGGELLARAAERLDREWAAFSSQAQSMGDIFGDDAVGGLIGASYEAAHQIADECVVSVAESFGDFGAALEECAGNHEANELEIAETFTRMLG